MVYLIHLNTKLSHSRHYIGWAKDSRTFRQRINHHKNGSGSRFMLAVNQNGITWTVVRTWDAATKSFERRLKNCKKPARFCPVCNPATWQNNMKESLIQH